MSKGKFANVHLYDASADVLVSHELLHLWIEWLVAHDYLIVKGDEVIDEDEEEKIVRMYDDIYRNYWTEKLKWEKRNDRSRD